MIFNKLDEMTLLWALAVSAFTSATILPGTSEAALSAFVLAHPSAAWRGFIVATLANTAGSLSSYLLGRLIPPAKLEAKISKTLRDFAQKYGFWSLALAWVPVVGDALCLAAGALRLNPWLSALALLAGKALRYAAVLGLLRAFGV
jgi:membrane protein YqaA with SNARE-associated domain